MSGGGDQLAFLWNSTPWRTRVLVKISNISLSRQKFSKTNFSQIQTVHEYYLANWTRCLSVDWRRCGVIESIELKRVRFNLLYLETVEPHARVLPRNHVEAALGRPLQFSVSAVSCASRKLFSLARRHRFPRGLFVIWCSKRFVFVR